MGLTHPFPEVSAAWGSVCWVYTAPAPGTASHRGKTGLPPQTGTRHPRTVGALVGEPRKGTRPSLWREIRESLLEERLLELRPCYGPYGMPWFRSQRKRHIFEAAERVCVGAGGWQERPLLKAGV